MSLKNAVAMNFSIQSFERLLLQLGSKQARRMQGEQCSVAVGAAFQGRGSRLGTQG